MIAWLLSKYFSKTCCGIVLSRDNNGDLVGGWIYGPGWFIIFPGKNKTLETTDIKHVNSD